MLQIGHDRTFPICGHIFKMRYFDYCCDNCAQHKHDGACWLKSTILETMLIIQTIESTELIQHRHPTSDTITHSDMVSEAGWRQHLELSKATFAGKIGHRIIHPDVTLGRSTSKGTDQMI